MNTNIKAKKLNLFNKLFISITAIVLLCLSFTMADLFSSLITVGGFTFTNNEINIPKFNVYAICTINTDVKALADENANSVKNQGGAGFIYMENSKFYVITSMYENEADAKKVQANLKEANLTSEIISINIEPIKISSNLEATEKSILESSLNIFKSCFKELYDISVSLDTSVINEVNARLAVNELASKVTTMSSNFSTLFNNQMSNNFLIVKLNLNKLESIMNELVDISNNLTPFSSLIKESYCKTIEIYKSLANELIKN